jgi:hypothetical protein
MTTDELRAAFEAGLRDDKCVMVLPHVGIALLDVIEAAKAQDAQFSRVLHELAGAASVCWKDGAVPTGEFDSTQACEHVANAVEELRGYMSDARAKLGELK